MLDGAAARGTGLSHALTSTTYSGMHLVLATDARMLCCSRTWDLICERPSVSWRHMRSVQWAGGAAHAVPDGLSI
jgi:hypothetical protein